MAFIVQDSFFQFSALVIVVVIGFQVKYLIDFMKNEGNSDDIDSFLELIESQGQLQKYPIDSENEQLNRLNYLLNGLVKRQVETKKEKEAEFQYLKNIVQHIGIGIITFGKSGKIQLINTAAKKLLRTSNVNTINDLKTVNENLVESLIRLRTGGRDLIRLDINGEVIQLAIYAIELTLRGEVYKLISLQNIQNELEEKEMEAWQNLVRVLTHEIMNSVTPISSLANTVETELEEQLKNDQEVNALTNEEVADLHLAAHTIQKRSEGLIKFVQDFRNLTHIPTPKLVSIPVKELMEELLLLLKKDVEINNVKTSLVVEPSDLQIKADQTMIEQVLINLIKNAIQAFDNQVNKHVEIFANLDKKRRPIITIKDNGNGIDDEAIEKIFIPFFTTKKSGSGIGLSLSRQIMRKHQGTLSVSSKIDEGTEFFLRF